MNSVAKPRRMQSFSLSRIAPAALAIFLLELDALSLEPTFVCCVLGFAARVLCLHKVALVPDVADSLPQAELCGVLWQPCIAALHLIQHQLLRHLRVAF